MPGPGEYRPDPTVGISRKEDLPKTKVCIQSRNYRRRRCPHCGHGAYRDRLGRRTLHDLGNPFTGRPRDIVVLYSQHYCSRCRKYFNADMADLADPGSHYTRRVIDIAVRLVVEDGLPYRTAGWTLWRDHRVFVPYATIQNWVEAGEKGARRIDTEHLDWALSDFSGSIAADELYDGPFCILSIVDNRTFKRISYRVLDHDPTHTDITAFFRHFHKALEARGLTLKGITTDGSPLYPEPIAAVFGKIPHQLCTFHIIRELTKAVLSALAKERKRLAATAPKLPRGRPRATEAARGAARRKKRIDKKVSDLFENRYLFVQRRLSPTEQATLRRVSRGLPQIRVLRELMEEVYRLFDRRCRTATAIAKLVALRDRVRRSGQLQAVLKKLLSPGMEKALVFLDERLIGATSNAVERGNRRYRKMQKTVYRVRTQQAIEGRLALDLLRESQAQGRDGTTTTLHEARAA